MHKKLTPIFILILLPLVHFVLGRSLAQASEQPPKSPLNLKMLEEPFNTMNPVLWKIEGRGQSGIHNGVLALTDCEAVAGNVSWHDYELSFRARAPQAASDVQLWASVRRTARDSRYIVGVRGGNNNVVYIARYAPNGRQVFLGVRDLENPPKPGAWQAVRIVVVGRELRVFLNGDLSPVLSVIDSMPMPLERGGISLGGGFLDTEFDDVVVRPISSGMESEFGPLALKLNFQPESMEAVSGWTKATGAAYSQARGFGWKLAITSSERKRNLSPDPVCDSLVSVTGSQTDNEFLYSLPNGDYLVTLWVGDPAYDLAGRLCFNGDSSASEVISVNAGKLSKVVRILQITDGQLSLKIERVNKLGLSVQALIIEPRGQVPQGRWEGLLAEQQLSHARARQALEHLGQTELKRQEQRSGHRPITILDSGLPRMTIPLDGKWLFLPDYEFKSEANFADPQLDDRAWHVMDVPSFWTRADNWLYDDRQGGSDRWLQLEKARLGQYTFDGLRTQAAWYRQTFDLKELLNGRRFDLNFDAIANVAEIYINGHRVGESVGMFRPSQTDVSPWVRQGINTIAVRVGEFNAPGKEAVSDKVATVAVTVAVTERMLRSLPHSIYCGQPRGIWQPVNLVIRQAVQIKDIFFQPRLDGAKIDLTLENQSEAICEVVPQIELTNKLTGAVLKTTGSVAAAKLKVGEVATLTLDTGLLAPVLWSPANPNLYTLRVSLQSDSMLVDERRLEVGFRTFETREDGRLYLNGKPYWLRGASHTPMPSRPNDSALAETFTKLMHEGNVRVTRSTCAPWNELWLSSADRNGVGVSQEGTWPWLMIDGKVPDPMLLEYWREEHLALIKKYRNHPSILFWTFNNESYYVNHKKPEVMEATVSILSNTIKAMRELDPTRPICPDSGGIYSMFPPFYQKLAKDKGFDYGDIDDKHSYISWYGRSFYFLYPEAKTDQFRKDKTPGRPLISQEMATGYPNADDGHSVRKYIFDHMVPQAWVGDYCYEQHDPRYLLDSVAFHTKELAETLRCYYRDTMAGVLHFALNCWFKNLFEADRIQPYPPAKALATALQPVLVSARLFGRHFYAGTKPKINVFVCNDDEEGRNLGETRLTWSLKDRGQCLAKGEQSLPALPYYQNAQTTISLELPETLPQPRVNAQLCLELFENGKRISNNQVDLIVAEKQWVATDALPQVLDVRRVTSPLWSTLSVAPNWLKEVPNKIGPHGLVVCEYGWVDDSVQLQRFLQAVASGGRVVLNAPGIQLQKIFPELVKSFRKVANGEIVSLRVPESPVFDGLEVMDLRWFNRGEHAIPLALHGDFKLAEVPEVEVLAKHTPQHGYLNTQKHRDEIEGSVIFSLRYGLGEVLVTQLAHDEAAIDPISARVLRNLLQTVRGPKVQD